MFLKTSFHDRLISTDMYNKTMNEKLFKLFEWTTHGPRQQDNQAIREQK